MCSLQYFLSIKLILQLFYVIWYKLLPGYKEQIQNMVYMEKLFMSRPRAYGAAFCANRSPLQSSLVGPPDDTEILLVPLIKSKKTTE